MVKSTKTHKKKIKLKSLILRLDIVFSKYIRLRDKGICITCGKQDEIGKMDCGHYVSRIYKPTRWHEKNCSCQCPHDNRFMEGCKDVFALKLQEKYGNNILQELNTLKNQVFKLTPEWLEDKIEYYKEKVKEME